MVAKSGSLLFIRSDSLLEYHLIGYQGFVKAVVCCWVINSEGWADVRQSVFTMIQFEG